MVPKTGDIKTTDGGNVLGITIQKSEEALTYLGNGEFQTAKSIFSVLLDRDPEDIATISGFYIASFWDHRL
ncbi:hypothetical protein EHQ60_18585, partial [Leptospira levettii]